MTSDKLNNFAILVTNGLGPDVARGPLIYYADIDYQVLLFLVTQQILPLVEK